MKAFKRTYETICVADGVGSLKGSGELARAVTAVSSFAIEKYLTSRGTKRDISDFELDDLIASVGLAFSKMDLPPFLCSTVGCVVLGRRSASVFWAGDTRIYALYESGELVSLSHDHADDEGALTSFVRGDGCVKGSIGRGIFCSDRMQVLAVVSDGVYNCCTIDELRSFLIYLGSSAALDDSDLCADFVAFAGSNLGDNATMGLVVNPRHKPRIQKAAYLDRIGQA